MRQPIRLIWESQEVQLPRVAFRLRIKAGKEAEYDAAHRNVWIARQTKHSGARRHIPPPCRLLFAIEMQLWATGPPGFPKSSESAGALFMLEMTPGRKHGSRESKNSDGKAVDHQLVRS